MTQCSGNAFFAAAWPDIENAETTMLQPLDSCSSKPTNGRIRSISPADEPCNQIDLAMGILASRSLKRAANPDLNPGFVATIMSHHGDKMISTRK